MEINNIIYKMLKQTTDFLDEWKDDLAPFAKEYAEALVFKVRDILAVPLRNCDVGTAEEQFIRWEKLCESYGGQCSKCNFYTSCDLSAKCFAKWSQMLYESEVK